MTAVAIQTIVCRTCGQVLPDSSKFCTRCGTAVVQAAPVVLPGRPGFGAGFGAAGPATTGRRLAAFSLDVLAVVVVGLIVLLATSSLVYAAVAVGEAVIFLWAWEAVSGATIGNLLLRIRTARAERPYTPGAGRMLVRSVTTAAGFVVAGIGAWLVVGSSAWDRSGRGQGWNDKLARTVVVAVPRRQTRAPAATIAAAAGTAPVAPYPGYQPYASPESAAQAEPLLPYLPPQVSSTRSVVSEAESGARPQAAVEAEAPIAVPPTPAPAVEQQPVPIAPQPLAEPITIAPPVPVAAPAPAVAAPAVAAPAPATPAPVPALAPVTALLFTFDTGQEERVATPGTGFIGRNPSAPGNVRQLIVVNDPDSTVSKKHLEFEVQGEQLWITDLGSTNGSGILLGEGRMTIVPPAVKTEVPAGARVRLGDRSFAISAVHE
jgi:hypothetical protein